MPITLEKTPFNVGRAAPYRKLSARWYSCPFRDESDIAEYERGEAETLRIWDQQMDQRRDSANG